MPAPDLSSFKVTTGEVSSATKFDNLVQAIQDEFGDIDADQVAGYPSDGSKFLAGDGTWKLPGEAIAPTGSVSMFAGAVAPSGWALCDGAAVSRTTFAALFAVIGTTYGVGDGSTTFNLPDVQGRMVAGKGSHADVDALGDNDGAALADRRPKHKHTVNDPTHDHQTTAKSHGTDQNVGGGGGGIIVAGSSTGANITLASTGVTIGPQTSAPTDGPAYIVLNYIIKT